MFRMSLHKCMTRRLSHASLVNRLSRHSPCMSLRGRVTTAAISCLLFLVACGGDSSSSKGTEPAEVSDIIVDSFDDLLVCSDKREGATAYVKDKKTAYVCKNGDWVVDDDEFSSSSVMDETSSSSRHCEDCKDETTSSSSTNKTNSSSSAVEESSSSVDSAKSSSSVQNESSSSVTLSSSSSDINVIEESSSSADSSNLFSSDSGESSSSSSSSSDNLLPPPLSSSSVIPSSSEESSSSIDLVQSSSSVKDESSSSVIPGTDPESSSSSVELSCSALLEGIDGWSWDIPKKCRFNLDITYGIMTDTRDGQTYKTVKIGDQTWMAENLNYADSAKTPSLLKRSWCFNKVAANCAVAGRLYTWAAAIDSVRLATDAENPQDCGYGKTCTLPATVQGICPDGWHLPTREEWNTLFTEVGGESTAGEILKSQTGWYDNGNGTDGVGFSALPAGRRYNGKFDQDGECANFWGAFEFSSGNSAYRLHLYYNLKDYRMLNDNKRDGASVRCLKD